MTTKTLSNILGILEKYGDHPVRMGQGYVTHTQKKPVMIVHTIKPDHMSQNHIEIIKDFGCIWDLHLAQWIVEL
jgi:hypothetical protein